jgi:hypothetical protein
MADPIIASSEFDPSGFIKGIDDMTAALQRLSKQEDAIRQDLTNINTALVANGKQLAANQQQIAGLDKSAADYQSQLQSLTTEQQNLTKQQTALQTSVKSNRDNLVAVNKSAADYKNALTQLSAVSKQVAADNKGRTLFDLASMNQQIKQLTELGSKVKNIFQGKIDTGELDELENKLAASKDQFQELGTLIQFVGDKLQTLDPNSQEFQDLNQLLEAGNQLLTDYADVTQNVDKRSQSLSGRLKDVRNELGRMIEAGEEGTDAFRELQSEAAELQDTIDKTGERVRTFANDTRLIEGGIEALRGLAAGYEIVAGTSALFGIKNEAAEETIKRVTSIIAVANGLQEVSNLLKKESVVRLVAEEVATKAYIITQRILAATLGTTAAASRGLALALTATGIGALVVGIGLLVTALSKWAEEAKEAARQQELLNVATETGIKIIDSFVDAIGEAGEKFAAEAEVRQALNQQLVQSDVQALRSRAANAQELRDIELKTLEEQLAEQRKFERAERANYDRAADRRREALEGRIQISDDELEALNKAVENFTAIQERGYALEHQLEITRLNDQRDQANERAAIRRAEITQLDDYLKRLEELRKRLLDAQNKALPQDAAQIAKQAGDSLRAQQNAINRDVRKGVLTKAQGDVLKDLLKQINGVELTTELKEFTKKSLQTEQSIQDQITSLRLKVGAQRAELIRDEHAAEVASLEATIAQERQDLEQAQREALQGIQDAREQGFLSPQQAQENSDQVRAIYQRLFNQLTEQAERAQEEIASKVFQRLQEDTQRVFAGVQTFVSEQATKEIVELTRRYQAGQISYKRYQRELTKIAQEETERRIRTSIRENEALLAGVQARIQAEKDPTRLKQLQDQENQLRQTISQLKRELAGAEVTGLQNDKKAFQEKVQAVAQYAQAIGAVVEQVVQFWARANQAEQEQLDRSIAIQEKRVDAATRIAERGNAEYLRLEEDRLNELHLKQENAARRQLAINAVLQTSQALTAFVTALAQGIATGGPLGGLAIAAAVLGAIASGYAIVQSLQQNTPQELWEGTPYVEQGKNKPGRDTVPAMLTAGEAVLPVDVNQDYHPAVRAIYERQIPAEEMNNFVNSYRVNRRQLPELNHQRLGEVAEVKVGWDGRLLEATETQNRKLEEQNDLLNTMNRRLAHFGINMTMDKNGFAVSVNEVLKQMEIDKKA